MARTDWPTHRRKDHPMTNTQPTTSKETPMTTNHRALAAWHRGLVKAATHGSTIAREFASTILSARSNMFKANALHTPKAITPGPEPKKRDIAKLAAEIRAKAAAQEKPNLNDLYSRWVGRPQKTEPLPKDQADLFRRWTGTNN